MRETRTLPDRPPFEVSDLGPALDRCREDIGLLVSVPCDLAERDALDETMIYEDYLTLAADAVGIPEDQEV